MDLPVISFCSDHKRSHSPFLMFCKSKNSIMIDKGGVVIETPKSGVVIETPNNCQTDYLNTKATTKFHSLFAKSYNHSPFITSFSIVGGFLGSKSQVRSTINQGQYIWDFIKVAENLSSPTPDLIKSSISKDQFATSSVPSPPKKKFAKEEPQELEANKNEFPSVNEKVHRDLSTNIDYPKQSYAEVAKSVCTRPTASGKNQLSSLRDEKSDTHNSSDRRQQSLQRKTNRRKRSRRERRNSKPPSISSVSNTVPQSFKKEDSKQSRTAQSNPSHSPVRNCSRTQEYPKYSLRKNNWESDCRQTSAGVNSDHRPYFHSGIGRKRPAKSRSYNCDIGTVNWRTGEPIRTDMPVDCVNESCRSEKPVAMEEEMVTLCDEYSHESGKHNDHSGDGLCAEQLQTYNRRRSFSSECSLDSEDSFIVFQSGAFSDTMSDVSCWSDIDSEDSFDDDSDSVLEFDMCDGYNLSPSSQRLQEVNLRWDNDSETPIVSGNSSGPPCNQTSNKKKVQFSVSKPTVHRMLAWDYAYRSSRVGPWEEMARDRSRFQCRIQQYENLLSPVLDPEHRAKVWNHLQSQS